MYLQRLLNITILLFVTLLLNSCAAMNAPVNAVNSLVSATGGAVGKVARTGIRTTGAIIGAPYALMQ